MDGWTRWYPRDTFPTLWKKLEELCYPDEDRSWEREWESFSGAIRAGEGRLLNGGLNDARYAWAQVEAAYAAMWDIYRRGERPRSFRVEAGMPA